MSNIKFISHESFPEDQYTKEIVYVELNVPMRLAYVKKQSGNGGMFWSTPSIAVTKHGKKVYYNGFMQDSAFLEKDIKEFLEKRKWENKNKSQDDDDHLPF